MSNRIIKEFSTMTVEYEFWDAELKNQSKRRMKLLEKAIAQTGTIVTDRYEDLFFKEPKLQWRNPLLLRIKLPAKKRWEFILATKCTIWLAAPPRIQIGYEEPPRIPLRGNHNELRRVLRRTYKVNGYPNVYIKDHKPELNGGYDFFEGSEIVSAVLNGHLEILQK
jgi:hypothetical protein